MKVICPQCGKQAHATLTVANNYLEIRRCYNQVEVMKNCKKQHESCGYSGFVKNPNENGGHDGKEQGEEKVTKQREG